MLLCGCKQTPDVVKNRMKDYGDNSQLKSEDISYFTLSDLKKTDINKIKVDLDNMILPDKVNFSEIKSISLLDLSYEDVFAEKNRELLTELFNVDENCRLDDTEYQGAKSINYKNDKQELSILDNGFYTYFSGFDFGDIGTDVYQKRFIAQYDTDVDDISGKSIEFKDGKMELSDMCNKTNQWVNDNLPLNGIKGKVIDVYVREMQTTDEEGLLSL